MDGQPAFCGNRWIAISWTPGHAPPPEWLAPITNWASYRTDGVILACERADCFARQGAIAIATGAPALADRGRPAPASASSLLAAPGQSLGANLAAPFTVAKADRDVVTAATDSIGAGQIFLHQAPGRAIMASSATMIATMIGARVDIATMTGFALLGSFFGNDSAFLGVAKLPAGHCAVLAQGRIEQHVAPAAPAADPHSPLDEIFRGAVAALRGCFPAADIELSGGLDSRLILAAIPPEQRAAHRAITIGPPDSADARIAARIAARLGLEHRLVATNGAEQLDGAALAALLDRITTGYDHAANPIDKVAIVMAGRHLDSKARFGGQNGEILRGFYYPGENIAAVPDESTARRLIERRMKANDRVLPDLLRTKDAAAHEAALDQRIIARLLAAPGAWGSRLDHFYLAERMQRWVGASCGNRFIDRANLYPFFDRAVIDRAMAMSPGTKRDSRAALALLCALDPALAAMPLDSGIVPLDVRAPGRMAMGKLWRSGVKAADHARRRLSGRSRETLGSQGVVARWSALELYRSLPVDAIAATGMVDEAVLAAIARGTTAPDRATLGFLLLLGSAASIAR